MAGEVVERAWSNGVFGKGFVGIRVIGSASVCEEGQQKH